LSEDEIISKDSDSFEMGRCDAHHPVIAAIDLGTNSCRLLVASVNIASLKKTFFRTRPNPIGWKIIDSFAKIVRLGEGLHKDDMLSEDAIERALEALAICKKKIDMRHVSRMRAVATEACRRAKNGHVLVDRAKAELGLDIDIVTATEEGRLALTGCAGILNSRIPYAAVFDIGGGSTEIIWLRIDPDGRQRPGYPILFEVIDSISIPYGVVTLSELYAQFAASREIHNDIRSQVREAIDRFTEKNGIRPLIDAGKVQMVGSSGTVTTLAALKMGLPRYERKRIDGVFLNLSDVHEISQSLLEMEPEARAHHPCIGGGRSDLVVVGSAILEGICDSIPTPHLRVADRGVREGILSELLMTLSR
jgi:exopolyphosphatase/guanosine-5'-triphosphate,3'-diphosphate pyrophosphatase